MTGISNDKVHHGLVGLRDVVAVDDDENRSSYFMAEVTG
jgi:hypothetical protein